ncbi:hypothetical protein GALMADRAFT_810363 [Galerina marginata CBS 339.88]|uniref:Uncharacterized protein n=1 Tax=Galerina marginata (strain CBS 339.88) TaxID=685588 RepID=A0A067ST10_GALM3|nr:hypothetical protein GALMADRAFT_810363 [Galerina marginata CBS 339.88]
MTAAIPVSRRITNRNALFSRGSRGWVVIGNLGSVGSRRGNRPDDLSHKPCQLKTSFCLDRCRLDSLLFAATFNLHYIPGREVAV